MTEQAVSPLRRRMIEDMTTGRRGARRKLTAAHHQPPCGTGSRLFGGGLHLPGVEFVAVVFAERLRALLTAVAFARKLRRRSRPEL